MKDAKVKGCRGTKRIARSLGGVLMVAALAGLAGCGTGEAGKKRDDFFTSGSREADQRATQRMAKEEQLATARGGSEQEKPKAVGEGTGGAGKKEEQERKQTLFERLGGEQGIAAIVDDFTARALADPRVNWERSGVKRGSFLGRGESVAWKATPENVARLKKHLVQFIALATGGPARYDGKEMKAVHEGMRIGNPEFDAAVGDLKASLDKLQIPTREQKELLAIVESTRPQIVTIR